VGAMSLPDNLLPVCDMKTVKQFRSMFVRSLPKLLEMAKIPVQSAIPFFFSDQAESEEQTRRELNDLNVALETLDMTIKQLSAAKQGSPEIFQLLEDQLQQLLKRALCNLKCGFGTAAEDDLNRYAQYRSTFVNMIDT
jgi:hypothetical protein